MKRLTVLLFALAFSCSRNPGNVAAEVAPAKSNQWTVAAAGKPYGLLLTPGALTFCDGSGSRKLDLKSGVTTAGDRICPKDDEPNVACSGLGDAIEVRAQLSEGTDIVDIAGASVPLKGKVHDCAGDGKTLAIATGSNVVRIDLATQASQEVSQQAGDHVAVGSGWIAWTQGSTVRTEAAPPAKR